MNSKPWPDWQVTKLDAARRQLEMAIRLLFEQADSVSTHTLAHASFGILKDVAEYRNARDVLNIAKELAFEEKKDSFWKGFNRTGNFFKHGNKDPEEVLSGTPEEENEALISLAVTIYLELNGQNTPAIEAFFLWWRCINFACIEDE